MRDVGSIDIDDRPFIVAECFGRAEMVDGRPMLIPHEPGRFLAALSSMVGRGELSLLLTGAKKKRSIPANRYLWACYRDLLMGLRDIAQRTGERCPFKDADAIHEMAKYIILGVTVTTFGGAEVEHPASTTVLNSAQFAEYVAAFKRLSYERWRVYIREPEEMGAEYVWRAVA